MIEIKGWNETPIKSSPFFILNLNGTSAITGQKQNIIEINKWIIEFKKKLKDKKLFFYSRFIGVFHL